MRAIILAIALVTTATSLCVAERSPPPDNVALAQTNREVREIFKADVAKARTPGAACRTSSGAINHSNLF
jgi:hypothetical protein